MPNIDAVFPSHYLKASDLGDSQPVVTIDRLDIEPIGRQKEMKPVLYFVGKEKGLVLNKTNARKIADLAGSKDTEDWAGTRIKLYATEVEFQGEPMESIRVKAASNGQTVTKPKPKPDPAGMTNPDDDDPIPF